MKPSRLPIFAFITLTGFCLPAWAATVEGKVTDAVGKPVAGAVVSVVQLAKLSALAGIDVQPEAFKTDAEGAFKLETEDSPILGATEGAFQDIVARARIQAAGYALMDVMLRKGANAIKLQPPAQVHGTVVDDKGAPVADALVRWRGLQTPEIQDTASVTVLLSMGLPAPETKSMADGNFSLPGSSAGTKSVLVLEDPRFQRVIVVANPGGDKVTIVARPAAMVKGRLVTMDNRPIPNVGIWVMQAMDDIRSTVRTDADGRFTIDGLSAGRIGLVPIIKDGSALGSPRQVEGVTAGQMLDIGDWKLAKGVEVTGQIVDQETGKPIPGISVGGTGIGQPKAVDAEGRFTLRMPAGTIRLSIVPGELPYMKTSPVLNVPGGMDTFDAGQIKLIQGEFLEGTVTVEGGESATGTQVYMYQTDGGEGGFGQATIVKDNRFRIGPLSPGKWMAQLAGRGWQTLEPKTFVVALHGQAQAPLIIKAKKLVLVPAGGRVIDAKGLGLPGAKVQLRMNRGNGTTSVETMETDAEGRFNFTDLTPEDVPIIAKVSLDNYEVGTTGTGTRGTDGWDFTPTELRACDGTMRIKVVDVAGKPANGALVLEARAAVKGKSAWTVETDGSLVLTQLAPGEATVLAALGRDFGRFTGKSGEETELELKAPATVRVEQMLNTLMFGASRKRIGNLVRYRDTLDDDWLLDLALRLDAAQANLPLEDSVASENVGEVMAYIVRHDPAKAAVWGVQQFERFPQLKSNKAVMLPMCVAVALKGDDAGREAVKEMLQEKSLPQPGMERIAENAQGWFSLAGLAAVLDDNHLQEYLDIGLTLTDGLVNDDTPKAADGWESWGEALGPGGLRLLARLDDEWKPNIRLRVLCGAATTLVMAHPEEAVEFEKKLTALAADPDVAAADNALEQEGESWRNSSRSLNRARAKLAQGLAASDPEAAMTVALKVTDTWMASFAYRKIMQTALAQGKMELAKKAVRTVKDTGQIDFIAYFAAGIRSTDAGLSDELFETVRTSAMQSIDDPYGSTLAGYAFYRAPYEPAQSRLILEGEWLRRKAGLRNGQEANAQYLVQIAAAMVALDPARALEMFNEAPDKWGRKDSARAQIIAYLASPSQARDTMPIGNVANEY